MEKLILLFLGLKVLLGGKGSAAASEPDPARPDARGGGATPLPPRERTVEYDDLLPGESIAVLHPTPNYPQGVPQGPPRPDAAARGYDDTSWRTRYPDGPGWPGIPPSAAWPGDPGGRDYSNPRGAHPLELAWGRWMTGVDFWGNPLNKALRADLASNPNFDPINPTHELLTFGVLDEIAVRALRALYDDAPVPLVQAPWGGCPATGLAFPKPTIPAWSAVDRLARYRRRYTQFVPGRSPARGAMVGRLLDGILADVRQGSIYPTCSPLPIGEVFPPLPSPMP